MLKRSMNSLRFLIQRGLAVFGAAGLLGAVVPAEASVSPQRAQLEARVSKVRSELARTPGADPSAPTVVAGDWNNWPKWNKWAKWANG